MHCCKTNCMAITYNSYLPVIGVHEMHGRMHPPYWQITILLVVDLCSSLAYFTMTQPLPIAGKLPIKTLIAKQLPTSIYTSLTLCNNIIPYPRERGPTTECRPTPHFGLKFLLRSSVYSNMHPCVAALENAAEMAGL